MCIRDRDHDPVLYIRIANIGEIPVKIQMVYLYYEVPDLDHYVGASAFVGVTEYQVSNPLIVLYGSNPIPPNQETVFKAKLAVTADYMDEYGGLKPGNYVVRAISEKETDAFYTIKVLGVEVRSTLQSYLYRDSELIVNLEVENVGDTPFIPSSNNLKVYVDGRPWRVFYEKECTIAPGRKELIKVVIPLRLVPYSNIASQPYPYVDLEKQIIVNLVLDPEFAIPMLREHTIIINVSGVEHKIRIPPINVNCRVLNVEKIMVRDARGQPWWHILSIKLEAASQWISELDVGWFNKIEICLDGLCEAFTVYNVEFVQKNSQTYIVTIYPSGALYPADKEGFTLHVYYGELKVASVELS